MGRVERFKDLVAWQKARYLEVEAYRVTTRVEFRRDFILRDQLRRAAVLIMSNIAGGVRGQVLGDFITFL